MSDGPARMKLTIAGVLAGGRGLAALDDDAIAQGLSRAAARIGLRRSDFDKDARTAIESSSALSPAMVDYCLAGSCAAVSETAVRRLLARAEADRPGVVRTSSRLAAVVLAGNVFTAALRAVVVPLALRVPVVCKASTKDDVLPRVLKAALEREAPAIAAAFDVVTFPGGDEALETVLFAECDVVSAHGSDATISAIRERIPKHARLLAHGHGLGAVLVTGAAISDAEERARVAHEIATDVGAYDQRGCLSPHFVLVAGEPEQARELAIAIEHALGDLARSLPRGALAVADSTAQLQWRGVALARGELFEGDGHAVSFEGPTPRLSPGFRNVAVVPCRDVDEAIARLAPMGVHLKSLGVAGVDLRSLAARLPAPLAPRVCDIGQMQLPPLDALTDGELPWSGFARYIEIE